MVRGMGPTASELRTIQLFQGFGDAELAEIGGLFTAVTVDPAKPLFDVGDPGATFYLLVKGEVELTGDVQEENGKMMIMADSLKMAKK